MTSTSSEPAARPGYGSGSDLRTGRWTRLGHPGILGDAVTEAALEQLTEKSHQAATAQGFAQGWADGRRAAMEEARAAAAGAAAQQQAEADQARAEQRQALAALTAAVAHLETCLEQAVAELADRAVEVALTLTETMLGRELALATDPGADAVRRALSVAPDTGPGTVRLHPADRAALDPTVLAGTALTAVDDPTLERGDAVLETPDTLVDATLNSALARVREVLAP